MKNEHFPLEKILNVTASEYCASVGKGLNDYVLRGVHADAAHDENLIIEFAEEVPQEAEVVVNYTPHYSTASSLFTECTLQSADGTAMISKK